ncbi:MAG: very short patch repair endonuclease [Nitrosomonas sp.]|nr:MAG: very short patch repair endonuclease [Nitrosomonas sp.]
MSVFDFRSDPKISERMRRIRGKNTIPEITVRKICRELGQSGYRIHRKDLPGKPDIAFISRKVVIFVHGCFWHGHNCPLGSKKPKTNTSYWLPKIERNKQRDAEHIANLHSKDWRVLVIWECELKQLSELKSKVAKFISVKE